MDCQTYLKNSLILSLFIHFSEETDFEGLPSEPKLTAQEVLIDLIMDLSLSKELAELLASRLKKKKPP